MQFSLVSNTQARGVLFSSDIIASATSRASAMFTPINVRAPRAIAQPAAGRGFAPSPYFGSQRPPSSPLQEANGANDVVLLPTSALPDRLRSLFSFQFFNAMQSSSFDTLFATDRSVVLAAPTGSGKTVCFELAIARLLTTSVNRGQNKVYTIFPPSLIMRSYTSDQQNLFAKSVLEIGKENLQGLICIVSVSVKSGSELGGELTGDTDSPDALVLRDYDIIVTTPEKWDAVTRRRKDLAKFMELIQLFLVSNRVLISLIPRSMRSIS
jgi:ATP-dependent DNA helicase HFM1/MER3